MDGVAGIESAVFVFDRRNNDFKDFDAERFGGDLPAVLEMFVDAGGGFRMLEGGVGAVSMRRGLEATVEANSPPWTSKTPS